MWNEKPMSENGLHKIPVMRTALEQIQELHKPKAPDTRAIARMSLQDRLFSNRLITSSGCWEWLGSKRDFGYGRMSYKDHVHSTHRLAAHEWLGMDLHDSSIKVCHKCDNPPCFNPEHLYLGDQKTNMSDCTEKGRFPIGESNGYAKMTVELVKKMREMHATGKYSTSDLAPVFGISQTSVSRIVSRRGWKHVA